MSNRKRCSRVRVESSAGVREGGREKSEREARRWREEGRRTREQ
jgi:hypothetical protein